MLDVCVCPKRVCGTVRVVHGKVEVVVTLHRWWQYFLFIFREGCEENEEGNRGWGGGGQRKQGKERRGGGLRL